MDKGISAFRDTWLELFAYIIPAVGLGLLDLVFFPLRIVWNLVVPDEAAI